MAEKKLEKLDVIYEDNHLIGVIKPSRMLVMSDDTGDVTLVDLVKQYLKDKYNKPGNVFLGVLHRLDRPVSGIILFAKTSKGAARMFDQFKNHTIRKTYQALINGEPRKKSAKLVNHISKNRDRNYVSVYDEPKRDTKEAELSYETIGQEKGYNLLKIKIVTGRSHQIRAQLANIGCPILGDAKYGSPQKKNRIALWATNLVFKHPISGKEITLSYEPPIKEYLENAWTMSAT